MSEVVDIHKKNGKRPEFDVYIGRRVRYHREFTEDSKWRNRSPSLGHYEQWVRENLWADLKELVGKRLGCWCVTTTEISPVCCHGQVLMRLVREAMAETCVICGESGGLFLTFGREKIGPFCSHHRFVRVWIEEVQDLRRDLWRYHCIQYDLRRRFYSFAIVVLLSAIFALMILQ